MTLLGADAGPSVFGQAVTFTATVRGLDTGAGTPTGTVVFQEKGITLASVSLQNGVAAYTTSNLPVGSHTLTAVYQGDSHFQGSPVQSLSGAIYAAFWPLFSPETL
jgi:hypothetical protein